MYNRSFASNYDTGPSIIYLASKNGLLKLVYTTMREGKLKRWHTICHVEEEYNLVTKQMTCDGERFYTINDGYAVNDDVRHTYLENGWDEIGKDTFVSLRIMLAWTHKFKDSSNPV